MSNIFKNSVKVNIGTSPVIIYTAPTGKKSIVLSLNVTNTTGSGVSTTVTITDSSASVTGKLASSVLINTGDSLKLVDGDKIILEGDDYISVVSNTTTSIDCIAGILEDV